MSLDHSQNAAIIGGHSIALGTLLGTFAGILPPLATLIAIIFYVVQIMDSGFVKKHLRHWRIKRIRRRRKLHDTPRPADNARLP